MPGREVTLCGHPPPPGSSRHPVPTDASSSFAQVAMCLRKVSTHRNCLDTLQASQQIAASVHEQFKYQCVPHLMALNFEQLFPEGRILFTLCLQGILGLGPPTDVKI